jgi:hypothetical protein
MANQPSNTDVIVPARFDDDAIATDLEHLTGAAASALVQLRREVDRDGGLPKSHLLRCQDEGRDGTQLAGCIKTRVPWPDGPWGIVFRTVAHPTRPFGLRGIAYGERHPTRTGKPSVYEVASQRLQEILAKDLREEKPDPPAGIGNPPIQ